MNRVRIHSCLMAAAAIAIGGCSTQLIAPNERGVETAKERSLAALAQIQAKPGRRARALASHERGIYLPVRTIEEKPENPLARLSITVNREFYSIQELAQRITLLTGIPVIVAPDVDSTQGQPGPARGAGAPVVPPIDGAPLPPAAIGQLARGLTPIAISYAGPLSGLLDVAAARFGVSWQWLGAKRIRLYRFATRTWTLAALPGDMSLTNTIGNTSGNASGAGASGAGGASAGAGAATGGASAGTTSSATTSTQQAGVSFSGLSVWKAVDDSVKSMLSPEGKVAVTPATGTLTVTDTPQVLDAVGQFVRAQDRMLTRQVIVNVRVLSVELTRTDQYGINWNLVYQALSGNFGWTFSNAFATDPSASNMALKILGTAGSATNSDIKSWQGSGALIAALSTQGRVSQVTSASVTTLNNQTAPFQVGHQNSYLASSSTTVTANVGSTSTLTPGVVNTGFALNVVPHVLGRRRLLLQFTIDLSSLVSIDTVSSGGSSIQTPNVDTRDFMQRVLLDSGDTLVLTGFEQTSLNATKQGPGSPDNVAGGGGVNGNREHSVLVILIQPFVVQG